MDELDNMIKGLKAFEQNIGNAIKSAVEENQRFIINLNAESQLFFQGENADGKLIDSYRPYRPRTIQIKSQKGQPTNRVTLKDTGAFHRSFFLVIGTDTFEIKANDIKTQALITKYGNVIGLTDENMDMFARMFIAPKIQGELKKIAG